MKNQVNENNVQLLKLYIDNSREIYAVTECLTAYVEKRVKAGKLVTLEHLANCSSMQKVSRMAAKMLLEFDNIHASISDRRAAQASHAAYILECTGV